MEPFEPEEAVALIRACGGIAVLAHPWCQKDGMTLLEHLASAGLDVRFICGPGVD